MCAATFQRVAALALAATCAGAFHTPVPAPLQRRVGRASTKGFFNNPFDAAPPADDDAARDSSSAFLFSFFGESADDAPAAVDASDDANNELWDAASNATSAAAAVAAAAVAALGFGGDEGSDAVEEASLLERMPALKDLAEQDLTSIAADNYERLRALSGEAERLVRDLVPEESPLGLARAVAAVAAGALSNLGRELSTAGSGLVEAEVAELAAALFENNRGAEGAPGVSRLFPASAAAARVDLGAEADFLRRATRASELASVAYDRSDFGSALRSLNCSTVARGSTCDVAWFVCDSLDDRGVLERHVVLRGFDASDEGDDRVELVKRIVYAREARVAADAGAAPRDWDAFVASAEGRRGEGFLPRVEAHGGFLYMAERILDDVARYLDVAPGHRVVLAGHSIGGSIATLLAVLMLKRPDGRIFCDRGTLRAFTFAALPCLRVVDDPPPSPAEVTLARLVNAPEASRPAASAGGGAETSVLAALGLDEGTVSAFVQPWDPLVRWYSECDPCYPLVGDIADDGVTLYSSGPARALRPLARAVFRAAPDWPAVRDLYKREANGRFSPTGDTYLIVPDETRYLADRVLSIIVDVPEPLALVRIAPAGLFGALEAAFPLEAFSISLVPAALRSFVHHFHPAYTGPLRTLRSAAAAAPPPDGVA